jgi:two-component system, OmpR family, sensor kinase
MRLPRTIRFRLTLWYCLALAFVMLASGFLIYGIVHQRLMRHHDEPLRQLAIAVQHILNEQEDCHMLTPEQTKTLNQLGSVILFHDVEGGHEVFYQSPEASSHPTAPTINTLGWSSVPSPVFETMQNHGKPWRVLSWPYQARSGRRGVIRLMQDLGDIQATLRNLRLTLLLLIPAGIALSALGGYWLSGKALAPVDHVTRMAQEIEAHHLDRRLPHPGAEDEIGRLVETLNHMIGRLETSFTAMKRFTADASHELRSPLATMRNTIDVVLERPRSGEEQQAAIESLGEDVDRLRKIVEDLLLLARADAGRLVMQKEPVRLDLLARDLVETYEPRAEEASIALKSSASGPVEVLGNERWLYQLLGNLIDNALKFTPPNGTITVSVTTIPTLALLTVKDTGPGIPIESLDRVFERFYQVDPSRTHRSGAGLGLAITAWIAESHGGRIRASNNPEGGACFTVELPLQA